MMVTVMQIREVRMTVTERLVHVDVAMRLAGRGSRRVGVLVVFVVDVRVRVLERVVVVLVVVPLGQVKPYARPHEDRGEGNPPGERLMEREGARDRSHERRGREVRPRPSGAQETEGEDEQDEARAVAQEADNARAEKAGGGGQGACWATASRTLIDPAARPLTAAICSGSPPDTMRVRLLSIAHARQAPVTSRADPSRASASDGFHDRTAAPPAMAAMPMAIRASKFSRKMDQASSAVKTPSRFSRSEDWTAVPAARPYMSNTGPMMPPAATAPPSHGRSCRLSGASDSTCPANRRASR